MNSYFGTLPNNNRANNWTVLNSATLPTFLLLLHDHHTVGGGDVRIWIVPSSDRNDEVNDLEH